MGLAVGVRDLELIAGAKALESFAFADPARDGVSGSGAHDKFMQVNYIVL